MKELILDILRIAVLFPILFCLIFLFQKRPVLEKILAVDFFAVIGIFAMLLWGIKTMEVYFFEIAAIIGLVLFLGTIGSAYFLRESEWTE